jgi:hypothetical protein
MERQVYIEAAKQGFQVIGYYFQSKVEDCKRRNEQRPGEERIPVPGIVGAAGRKLWMHEGPVLWFGMKPSRLSERFSKRMLGKMITVMLSMS